MAELKTRVEELRLENDYQLRLKDMTYSEKKKELTDKFIEEMESLKTKNQACTLTLCNILNCIFYIMLSVYVDNCLIVTSL